MRIVQLVSLGMAVAVFFTGTRIIAEEHAPQRYALLIGVNSYTHLADLHFCENDMRSLREACIAAGFPEKNVTLMTKSSDRPELIPVRNHILEQMKVLLGGLKPNDLVLVAFSGHGVHVGNNDYFCTIDSKVEDPQTTMVPAAEVVSMLERCPAQQKLLIIDACRNDPLPEGTRSVGGESVATAFTRSIAAVKDTASHGLAVLASCDEKQVSVEDPQLQHGVFMNYVINGLLGHADANRDKQVTLLELHMYAEYETRNYVRTTRSMLQTPSLRGEFTGNYVLAQVNERPLKLDLQPVATSGGANKGPSSLELKLYDEAYGNLQQGKTAEAVKSFEQLIRLAEDPQLKKVSRLKLADAYMALDPAGYIGKALEINNEAGIESVPLIVQRNEANIMLGEKALAYVTAKQIVGVTKVEGEWYYVTTIDGHPLDPSMIGYIHKSAFVNAPPVIAANSGQQQNTASNTRNNYGYGYGYASNNGNYSGGSDFDGYRQELDYVENSANRGQVNDLRRGVNELERMEARGAGPAAIRAKENEIYRKAEQLQRQEEFRQGVRSLFGIED